MSATDPEIDALQAETRQLRRRLRVRELKAMFHPAAILLGLFIWVPGACDLAGSLQEEPRSYGRTELQLGSDPGDLSEPCYIRMNERKASFECGGGVFCGDTILYRGEGDCDGSYFVHAGDGTADDATVVYSSLARRAVVWRDGQRIELTED